MKEELYKARAKTLSTIVEMDTGEDKDEVSMLILENQFVIMKALYELHEQIIRK